MGKTTLLNLLMGKLECSQGEIARNKACRVGFLEQKMDFPDDMSIQDYFDQHNTDYFDYQEWEYAVRLDKITRELHIKDLLTQTRSTLS